MTNKTTATLKDTGNVEAWSEVIAALLCLAPPDKRLEVLRLAAKHEAVAAPHRLILDGGDCREDPGLRWHGCIQRLKSLAVQVFVRDIASSTSAAEAERILFSRQLCGHGSGCLGDYLGRDSGRA